MPLRGSTVQLGLELARRPRRHVGRSELASGDGAQRLVPGRVEDRRRGQQPEQRDAREHPAAFLGHEQRVEPAEPGTAVLLVDQQPRPPGLDRGRPQVRQRVLVLQRVACRLDRLEAAERAARGLTQEDLLVRQCEIHEIAPSFSLARSSLNGTPLSSLGSGGNPRTRSPIVLRRICSVPPADFRPGRNEIR